MGVPHLDPNIWANLEFAIPPLAEQCHIADYLDEKISSIDFYISGRENELKLLKLFKQSRINEVVVRGLKRDAEFIEWGIDWLGIIPRHWRVRRIKDIFYESTELTSEGNEDLLSVSEYYGVAKRKERMDDDEEFESSAESLEGYKICHKGDLVSNIMLTWKRALGVSEYDGIVSPAYGVYRGIDIFRNITITYSVLICILPSLKEILLVLLTQGLGYILISSLVYTPYILLFLNKKK